MSEGYDKFEVGNFPLSGCFSKDSILYWGTGENFDQSMDLEAFFQSGDVEGVFCLTYETPNDEIDVMQGKADIAAIENTIKELDDEMDVIHGEAAIENTINELDDEMDAMHGEADIAAIENTLKELDDEMVENDPQVLPELECLTEIDCEEQMSRGYEKFEVGDFPQLVALQKMVSFLGYR